MSEKNDTLQYLISYLKERGYPPDSLLINYKIGKYRADLVIADPQKHAPLQIFELKPIENAETLSAGKQRMKDYLFEAEKVNPDIMGYLIFPSQTQPFFKIIDVNTDKPVRLETFDFTNLLKKSQNAKETLISSNKTRAVGNLKWATILLVAATFVILLFDVFNIVEVTGYRLYLILMIIILVLLPYYETIKVANFELTQKQKDDRSKPPESES